MKILPKKPFTWIMIIVLVYGYITIRGEYSEPTVKKANDFYVKSELSSTKFLEKPIEAIVNKIRETPSGKAAIDAYLQQAIKEKYGTEDISLIAALEGNKIITMDTITGTGDTLRCGSSATIHYEGFIKEVVKFDSTIDRNAPITITIGAKQVIPGLENGLLGMQKGGSRKIAIPANLAYNNPSFKNDVVAENTPVLFEVELVNLKNGIAPQKPMMINEKTKGEGDEEVFCNSKVNLRYALVENNNNKHEGNLSLTLGNGNTPIGLEKGLMGMKLGGIREIIVPVSMLKNNEKNIFPSNFKLPKDGKVTLEVELLAIG